MPFAFLGAMLAQFFMPLFRLLAGAVFAKQIYDFLNSKIMPPVNQLIHKITQEADGLNNFSGAVGQLFLFLDLSGVIALLASTLLACFTIKVFIVSVKAFGSDTGE